MFYDKRGAVLYAMENNTESLLLQPLAAAKVYRNGNTKFSLNNDNEEITLEDKNDNIIDRATYNGSKEGLALRKVDGSWISEEKPKSEQSRKTESKKSSKKVKTKKTSIIVAPKDAQKPISKKTTNVYVEVTTTTFQAADVGAFNGNVVYQSSDVKASNSGIIFFGFTVVLLAILLLFKKRL